MDHMQSAVITARITGSLIKQMSPEQAEAAAADLRAGISDLDGANERRLMEQVADALNQFARETRAESA